MIYYNQLKGTPQAYHTKEVRAMSGKKKNGNQNDHNKVLILITVIIQLITAIVSLIDKLFG